MTAYRLQDLKWRAGAFSLRVEECLLERGRIYAVTGPNGSGKTSFLNVLSLIEPPQEGGFSFWDCHVDHADGKALLQARRRIAYLLQSPYLFDMSVWRNVAYGLKVRGWPRRRIEARVNEILARLRLSDLAQRNASTAAIESRETGIRDTRDVERRRE